MEHTKESRPKPSSANPSRDAAEKDTLKVFTAGVAIGVAQEAIDQWNTEHPELMAEMVAGGSVALIRRALAGERCDVMILADDTNIKDMMMPELTKGYYLFAGNAMVITGKDITSENWMDVLSAPDATFGHTNPYGDPSGYRAIFCILLADQLRPGIAEKLMNHPGHMGMEHDAQRGLFPHADYLFMYRSGAVSRGENFAELPESINLSNTDLAEEYAKASFAVDENTVVRGGPIVHALTIPETAKFADAAKEFSKLFLKKDFAAFGMIPRSEVVGEDILK
ncbi:MAG: hypothetical protein E7328_00470 [Clostridiales bacterium]|nr:hypothetical protein [Clostridiales bacterium]